MKRLILSFMVIIISAIITWSPIISPISNRINRVKANVNYLRVTSEDTPLYSNANGTDLICYLPYSYYVVAFEETGLFTRVEIYGLDCPAIDGYAPTYMLTTQKAQAVNPFPTLTVTTEKNCVLYTDTDLSGSVQYLFAGRNLRYLGYYFDGQKEGLFLVGYLDKIGYVKESDVYPFTLPLHPDPLPIDEPEETPTQPTTSQNPALKYGIIICLILAGVIALLVVFRPKKNSPVANDVFYDENDYS